MVASKFVAKRGQRHRLCPPKTLHADRVGSNAGLACMLLGARERRRVSSRSPSGRGERAQKREEKRKSRQTWMEARLLAASRSVHHPSRGDGGGEQTSRVASSGARRKGVPAAALCRSEGERAMQQRVKQGAMRRWDARAPEPTSCACAQRRRGEEKGHGRRGYSGRSRSHGGKQRSPGVHRRSLGVARHGSATVGRLLSPRGWLPGVAVGHALEHGR